VREPGIKQKGAQKTARIPVKVVSRTPLAKPAWIRVRAASPNSRFYEIKDILRSHRLHTVCEEASCPNIGECFGKGTATFMIMGDRCTRRCPFCDVGHGRPDPLDAEEPLNLARTIAALKLRYVVITSVDRDDLKDGGAQHFVDCIRAVRELSPSTRIEILVPDFRGRLERALAILEAAPPPDLERHAEPLAELADEAVADALEDQVVARRRDHGAAAHHPHVARRTLGQPAVAELHRLVGAVLGGELPGQHGAEQRHRLDVAAQPALVGARHGAQPLLPLRRRRPRERRGHREHGRRRVGREGEVALGHAARHLPVDELVVGRAGSDQTLDQRAPAGAVERVGQADLARAALEAAEVAVEAERPAVVHRHHLVDAVAEDEAAVEDRDLRLRQRQPFAVQVAGRLGPVHRCSCRARR